MIHDRKGAFNAQAPLLLILIGMLLFVAIIMWQGFSNAAANLYTGNLTNLSTTTFEPNASDATNLQTAKAWFATQGGGNATTKLGATLPTLGTILGVSLVVALAIGTILVILMRAVRGMQDK